MRRISPNIIGLLIGLAILFLAWFLSPQSIPPETWNEDDSRAFGGEVLHQMVSDYTGSSIKSLYDPLTESEDIVDSLAPANYLILGKDVRPSPQDWKRFSSSVKAGGVLIIGAHQIPSYLEEVFGYRLKSSNFSIDLKQVYQQLSNNESFYFHPDLKTWPKDTFKVPVKAATYALGALSVADSNDTALNFAFNSSDMPIARSMAWGKGQLVLFSSPELLQNYFLMDSASRAFSAGILSYLKRDLPTYHFEFYHLGRIEPGSPLRVLLYSTYLRTALYLGIALVLAYLLIGSKRRQKMIPVLDAFSNNSLDFLNRLSGLYYKNAHHRNMFKKRMEYWTDFVHNRYQIRLRDSEQLGFEDLARKLELDPKLLGYLRFAYRQAFIDEEVPVSSDTLLEQEKQLKNFYNQYGHGRKSRKH